MSNAEKFQVPAPLLLLLKGHPGSGKSTLAKRIATVFHMALSDKDDSRDCFKAAEEQHGPAGAWDLNSLSYEVMFRVTATQLACGQNVVVDCPLSRAELYHKAVDVAQKHNADVVVIECQPSDIKIWQQRLEARAQQEHGCLSSHKPTTWAELTSLIHRYDKQDAWSTDGSVSMKHYVMLDTSSNSTADHLSIVKQFLISRGLAQGTV